MTPVTHERARALLHAVRARLSVEEQGALDAHLASCVKCRAYAGQVADLAPTLAQALHTRWDGVQPPAGSQFNAPSGSRGGVPVRAWLTSLFLTGALTALVVFALGRPGLLERLGLAPAPTTTAMVRSIVITATPGPTPVPAMLMTWTANPERVWVHPVDPATLSDLPGYAPIKLGYLATPSAFSPDGHIWAVIAWPGDPTLTTGDLHLIDTVTWRDITTPVTFTVDAYDLVFSPDGSRLAVTSSGDRYDGTKDRPVSELTIANVQPPYTIHRTELNIISRQAAFSADGKAVVLYGSPWPDCGGVGCMATAPPHAEGFDANSGRGLWDLELANVKDGEYPEPTADDPQLVNYYQPGVTFSADGRWLYIVHAQHEQLTAIDLTAGELHTTTLTQPVSWLEPLLRLTAATAYAKGEPVGGFGKTAVLSPDGHRLYLTGVQSQVISDTTVQGGRKQIDTPQAPQVIDPATGQHLTNLEAKLAGLKGLSPSLSPDGRWLYWLRSGDAEPAQPGLQIVDATTLSVVAQVGMGQSDMSVAFAPDGQQAYLTVPVPLVPNAVDWQLWTVRSVDGQRLATRDLGQYGQLIVVPH